MKCGSLNRFGLIMAMFVWSMANTRKPALYAADTPSFSFKPYGYLKLDAAFDQARTNDGNYVYWVENQEGCGKDNEFNMTARQSRFGTDFGFPDANVMGRVEVDFYGGTEVTRILNLRHAFMKISMGPGWLLAGHTSDIISPLAPQTVNYIVLWNCGNIGHRHPQIQGGLKTAAGFEFVGGFSRNIPGDADGDSIDDGEDSGFPVVQGRIGYTRGKSNFGISGHYGVMEYTNHLEENESYSTYSINVHAGVCLGKAVTVAGEMFHGTSLNQYKGGIEQVFNINTEKEIASTGGWANVILQAGSRTSFACGMGMDQPEKDTLHRQPDRNYNRCVFANATHEIAQNTKLALEVSRWCTGYWNNSGEICDCPNLRSHLAFVFDF